MFLQTKQFYEFANFRLIPSEKLLLRDGRPVPLTPKVFDTLKILTENAGHLLEKDELMRKIWQDRFVEEGNLAFNIKVLRKALGDSAANPRFIETVPRRGYRFIAEVSASAPEPEPPATHLESESLEIERNFTRRNFRGFFVPLAATAILFVGVILLGGWFVRTRRAAAGMPVLHAPFASEKLSTNGKVTHAVLSPDGKNVVYTNGTGRDKESLWLRQIETGSNFEIIPPAEDIYAGLAFSPDGNSIYFVRKPSAEGQTSVYRMSIFGGVPEKIVSETQGWISLSPDGAHLSFVRCFYREDENCSLWVADAADGKNERKLVARPRPMRIGDSEFSPDGKTIAFAVGQSENASNEFSLLEVNLETGAERELTTQKFFNIKHLAWFPNGSGLFITASTMPNKNFRIWQISAATGAALPLTKDSETYSVLGLDKAATKIVSTQVKQNFRLRLLQPENARAGRLLADASGARFAPDGKIYFSSAMSGNDEIWTINPDGSGQKQLTNDAAEDTAPTPAADNRTVFFASNRTGAAQVWRMNADGSNQTQITRQEGGFPLFVSADGEWVYYQHGLTRTLWRVSIRSGAEQIVLNHGKYRFAISPDGSRVAFSERRGDERVLTIASIADRQPWKTFRLADQKARLTEIVWFADGKSLAYITTDNEHLNNILWQQPLTAEAPRRIAVLENDEMSETLSLDVSPDGKTFAVVQGGWLHDAVLFSGLR